jgi:hypothetical protein
MTIDKKDAMIEQAMADHNTAMAATAVSMNSEEGMVMEHEVSDEDFFHSSG